jgi:kinesin family protein C2/C3
MVLWESNKHIEVAGLNTTYSVNSHITWSCEPDNPVIFVNAGGEALKEEGNLGFQVQPDSFFHGGDVLRTDETIAEGGDIPSLYQSARVGNFCYSFNSLSPGDYFVDLHFAEIVNTNGPRGMRVFDVFMQEEKASKHK